MKMDGQLENAQLENLANSSPTPTPLARMYFDTNASLPRIYNGSAWLPFMLGQASALTSQNSSTDVTVDWSTGLNQQVVLTGHARISFTNPVSGQIHRLAITQRATEVAATTPYLYTLNMVNQYTRRTAYQPIGVLQSSESKVYTWFYSGSGTPIKAAYATVPASYPGPGIPPSTLIHGLAIHPFLNTLATTRTSSPFLASYTFYDGGAKFLWGALNPTTSSTCAASTTGVRYSPDGNVLFVVSATSPYLQAFPTDNQGVGSGSVWANPGTLPAGAGKCLDVHPSGSHVIIGHATTPFMSCYPIGQQTYGTILSNPATLPAAAVVGVAFSPKGEYLAVASATTPFLQVYPFDPNTGFGAVISNPSSLPANGPSQLQGHPVAWHPQGSWIAIATGASSPYVFVVPFSINAGTFGAPVAIFGAGAPSGVVESLAFSPCGNYLVLAGSTGNSLFVYDMNLWGTAAPIVLDGGPVGAQIDDVVFHPSGEIIFLGLDASPFIQALPMARYAKSYIKLLE